MIKKIYHATRNTVKQIVYKISYTLFSSEDTVIENIINADPNNPYLNARQECSSMVSDIVQAKHNWQVVGYLLSLMNILLVVAVVHLAHQDKWVPYIVTVDNQGTAQFAGVATSGGTVTPAMVNAMLRQYIHQARSVLADPIAQKHQLEYVYEASLGSTNKVLDEYYKNHNPFEIAKQETIDVEINSILPKSETTWQVGWTEIHRDTEGNITQKPSYEALVTLHRKTARDASEVIQNPLGLYVVQLSWSNQE